MRREMLAHRQPGRVAWRKLAAAEHGEPIEQALHPQFGEGIQAQSGSGALDLRQRLLHLDRALGVG